MIVSIRQYFLLIKSRKCLRLFSRFIFPFTCSHLPELVFMRWRINFFLKANKLKKGKNKKIRSSIRKIRNLFHPLLISNSKQNLMKIQSTWWSSSTVHSGLSFYIWGPIAEIIAILPASEKIIASPFSH
jgi:hypothetical protein